MLLAVTAQAGANGFDSHAWQLPWALADYFSRAGHWQDLAGTHRTALVAALRLGDRAGQARAHQCLGYAQVMSDPGQTRHPHLAHALALYRELGDQMGQAWIHVGFSLALEAQHRPQTAVGHARMVLSLAHAHGTSVWSVPCPSGRRVRLSL